MAPNQIHRDDLKFKLEGLPLNSDEIHKDLGFPSEHEGDHCRKSREDDPEDLAQFYIIDFNREASRFGFPITMPLCPWGGRYGGSRQGGVQGRNDGLGVPRESDWDR
ncbi:hypothetical protein MMC22_007456 [Lobaria immixta]|nr:hypothetical protein [Lobaria immixta]